jgi:hypothetical protein
MVKYAINRNVEKKRKYLKTVKEDVLPLWQ